jgi:hypothetical protein
VRSGRLVNRMHVLEVRACGGGAARF